MIECAGIYYDEPTNCPPDDEWEYWEDEPTNCPPDDETETPAEQGLGVDTQD